MSSGLSFSLGSKRPGQTSSSAAKKPVNVKDLFGAEDSDDEDVGAKKQRTSTSVGAGSSSASAAADAESRKACERLAEFVAKNGRSFEDMTRDRNPGNTPFKFLHDKSCAEYKYFDLKVREFEALSKATAPSAPQPPQQYIPAPPQHYVPAPPPLPSAPPPVMPGGSGGGRSSRWDSTPAMPPPPAPTAWQAPPAAPPYGGSSLHEEDFDSVRAKRAQLKGDSVGAMDAYMKLMAKKAAEKEATEAEEEAERKRQIPLLNETSFDRRKITAVFKSDGTRGHHMSDYIPAEELARLLAKGGDPHAKAAAIDIEKKNAIQSDNIGHKLLSKMGWKEGEGIGAGKDGITAPVSANSMRQDNLGLGHEAHGEVKEGDDPFEQYRKRMMLGYKHRPNPLGNPRKAYY